MNERLDFFRIDITQDRPAVCSISNTFNAIVFIANKMKIVGRIAPVALI